VQERQTQNLLEKITRVKPGTKEGTYTNTAYYFDNRTDKRFNCSRGAKTDVNDLDSDGDTDETICSDPTNTKVIKAAVIGGDKWIEGNATMLIVQYMN